jgi:hypothetical protein
MEAVQVYILKGINVRTLKLIDKSSLNTFHRERNIIFQSMRHLAQLTGFILLRNLALYFFMMNQRSGVINKLLKGGLKKVKNLL